MPALTVADLPPFPEGAAYTVALTDLIARVNGFVYAGDRLHAVVDAVRVLRADPDLARLLLDTSNEEI